MMCRQCGRVEGQLSGPGFKAWTCPPCQRASVRITDWRVWNRFRLVFEHGVLEGPPSVPKAWKLYVLRRERGGAKKEGVRVQAGQHPSHKP